MCLTIAHVNASSIMEREKVRIFIDDCFQIIDVLLNNTTTNSHTAGHVPRVFSDSISALEQNEHWLPVGKKETIDKVKNGDQNFIINQGAEVSFYFHFFSP